MEIKRLKHTLRLWVTLGSGKRTKYLREKNVFGAIGENCSIMDRRVPLYANLIRIGDNVHVASDVRFITHDITHVVMNNLPKNLRGGGTRFHEKIGCIEIRDNVFVGSGTIILGDVRIGQCVIVAAGSIVTKDVPDNSVVAGVPARVIGSFDDFMKKRASDKPLPNGMHVEKQIVPDAMAEYMWEQFREQREEG